MKNTQAISILTGPHRRGGIKMHRQAVTGWCRRHAEILLPATLLLAVNATVLLGIGPWRPFIWGTGSGWAARVLGAVFHPFVHASGYHFLLDATAFLILYSALMGKPRWIRLLYLVAAQAGALTAALWALPGIGDSGFCGLSGIAHGLMAVVSLDGLHCRDKRERAIHFTLLAVLVAKSAWEAVSGNVVFGGLHVGELGRPIAVCHAGGVVGALLLWVALRNPPGFRRRPAVKRTHP